jgi:hypothetical protein
MFELLPHPPPSGEHPVRSTARTAKSNIIWPILINISNHLHAQDTTLAYSISRCKYDVILNVVKDLTASLHQDSSLRSE